MGPKKACSYTDLAMGVIDKKPKLGEINPKLDEFTHYINSLYSTIKFTLVSSLNSLNVLDITLNLGDGFIQTDIYSKLLVMSRGGLPCLWVLMVPKALPGLALPQPQTRFYDIDAFQRRVLRIFVAD